MVRRALVKMRMEGLNVGYPTYEAYPETIKNLVDMGKVFKYNYNKFWMEVPDMVLEFDGDDTYTYQLIVGGEFLVIKPVKL